MARLKLAGQNGPISMKWSRKGLAASKDPREVVADPHGHYYGIEVKERTLVPDDGAKLGKTRFEDWLAQPAAKAAAVNH